MNPDIGALLEALLQGSSGASSAANPTALSVPNMLAAGSATPQAQPTDLSTLLASDPTVANQTNQVAGDLGGDVVSNGNENQMQQGAQTGAYSSADNTSQLSSGLSSSTLASLLNSLTQGSTTGATTGTSAGTTAGTTTTTPVDTLGMGAALQSQIPGATAATQASQQALQNIATQGNPYQQQLTNQAVSNSLSGPGMIGTGNAAQARAASNAGEQVAQNSVGNQLTAASELGGPTALTALSGAANPYIGSSTSNLGTNTGVNNTASTGTNTSANTQAGSQSSLGSTLSSLLGTDTSAGTAVGGSSSTAAGDIPQSSNSSSGGCYVCSVLASMGLLGKRSIRAAVQYKLWKRKDLLMALGYSLYGPWLAKQVQKHSSVQRLVAPIAKLVLYEELRLARRFSKFRLDAWVLHALFHSVSTALGFLAKPFYEPDTRDKEMRDFLARENLLINVHE